MTGIQQVSAPSAGIIARDESIQKQLEAKAKNYAKMLEKLAQEPLPQDSVQITKPKKKSFWKGLSSFFLTGSGQMFDGRFKDGFKQLGVEFGLGALSGVVSALGFKNFMKTVQTGAKTPYGWYASIAISAGLGIAAIVNKVKSVKDAYKCGQK